MVEGEEVATAERRGRGGGGKEKGRRRGGGGEEEGRRRGGGGEEEGRRRGRRGGGGEGEEEGRRRGGGGGGGGEEEEEEEEEEGIAQYDVLGLCTHGVVTSVDIGMPWQQSTTIVTMTPLRHARSDW